METQSRSVYSSVPCVFPRTHIFYIYNLTIIFFSYVLHSHHHQKSLCTSISIVPILIAQKKVQKSFLFSFRKCSHFNFYIVKCSSSNDAWNIFSSKDTPFSPQTDHLLKGVSLKIHRSVNFSLEFASNDCVPRSFLRHVTYFSYLTKLFLFPYFYA